MYVCIYLCIYIYIYICIYRRGLGSRRPRPGGDPCAQKLITEIGCICLISFKRGGCTYVRRISYGAAKIYTLQPLALPCPEKGGGAPKKGGHSTIFVPPHQMHLRSGSLMV